MSTFDCTYQEVTSKVGLHKNTPCFIHELFGSGYSIERATVNHHTHLHSQLTICNGNGTLVCQFTVVEHKVFQHFVVEDYSRQVLAAIRTQLYHRRKEGKGEGGKGRGREGREGRGMEGKGKGGKGRGGMEGEEGERSGGRGREVERGEARKGKRGTSAHRHTHTHQTRHTHPPQPPTMHIEDSHKHTHELQQ